MQVDKPAIREFLTRVHGPEPQGWLVLWTRQDKATRAFDLTQEDALDLAVDYCADQAERHDVYAAVGLQGQNPPKGSRGKEDGVTWLPGVWADVDIAGPAHKARDLPPDEVDALALACGVGLPPSIIVHSGHGLQVYWLFPKPIAIENDDDRQRLKSLSRRFQHNLRLHARTHGWSLDATADLCRVLRVPGTLNRKILDDLRPVSAEYSGCTYAISDIEDLLAGLDEPGSPPPPQAPPDFPPASLPAILESCGWMRHCQDDAATLPEPEWYRMLTIIARCGDASQWAHEISRPYPQYSKRETTRKLKQAGGKSIGPATCNFVRTDLNGARYCAECLVSGNVKSPISIGRIEIGTPRHNGETAVPEGATMPARRTAAADAQVEKYTDLGNARRFVTRHRGKAAYCAPFGKWFLWDGKRWRDDEKLEVMARAGDLIRSLYPAAKQINDNDERKSFLSHLRSSESHRSLSAMVSLAKSDSSMARLPDDFDCDPWLLSVENGTVDLRTGKLHCHDPRQLITKLAPVKFDATAKCPNWDAFLDLIMDGRSQLTGFLKRAFGTSLTGITSDKALFILYGPGGDNGKSTLVDVMQRVLGDYAMRTPVDTLLKKREGGIPNDIARLKGARFVWASENERGSTLSEALIKEMTGGDKLAARFMRAEFFEFMPEFKLWLATNHKPAVRGDAAIWRRLKLIPFDVSIPKGQQKPRHEVMAMFQAELPGILNRAIEGCLEWQREGLGVPDEVLAATQEYKAEQDTFAMFLDERCVRTPNARAASLELYQAYRTWSDQRGESAVTHKTFAALMSERSFAKSKTKTGAIYFGIGLVGVAHYDLPRPQASAWQNQHILEDEKWVA